MDEIANKIIDILREENLTIEGAKLALERAIRLLAFERLAPKK